MIRKVYGQLIYFILLVVVTGCGVKYHFNEAEKLKNENKYQESIVEYKKIIEKYSASEFSSDAQLTIANIYLYKIKNYPQSKVEYQLFLTKYPADTRLDKVKNEINKIDEITNSLILAQEYLQKGEIDSSIDSFEKVLKIDSDCQQAKQGLEQAKQEEIIEVKAGNVVLCESCKRVLKEDTKTSKVKRKDSIFYKVQEISQGTCSSCRDAARKRIEEEIINVYDRSFSASLTSLRQYSNFF
ncbi:MAG: hypothetical protein WC955_09465 [Elusimicrobiota bacterium]